MKRLSRFKVEEFLEELGEVAAREGWVEDDCIYLPYAKTDGAVIQFVQEWLEDQLIQSDIPELDTTDGAHPAWWRGHEHAVKTLCQKINDIIDGKDSGEGVSSEPWESVRRKLINAAYIIRRLEKAEKEFYARELR